jgi:1,4-alpha-glucan branching enzyme
MLNPQDRERLVRFLATDAFLKPHEAVIERRIARIVETARRLTGRDTRLDEFALGHDYFGLHFSEGQWILREWAPKARSIHLLGDLNNWQPCPDLALQCINGQGVWEIRLAGERLHHGDLYRLHVVCEKGTGDRIPAWTRRVVQDPHTQIFNAQVWRPATPYAWRVPDFRVPTSRPDLRGAYRHGPGGAARRHLRRIHANILPRVKSAGYNTLQIMAIPEHPYYGSFGYHVSSFFAAASRFGTPEELKALIDAAHSHGLTVLIDLVHSHAANNEVEGISRFDGTEYQFFHGGARGRHTAWDSRLFDYGKHQVLHFLLSNCRYWLDEFHVDGFRFDGITSMLYLHHGLGTAFTCYDDYFGDQVDEDALVLSGPGQSADSQHAAGCHHHRRRCERHARIGPALAGGRHRFRLPFRHGRAR